MLSAESMRKMFQLPLKGLFFLWFVLFGLLVMPLELQAKDAIIKDIVITNSTSHVLAYFKVMYAFTPQMEEGVVNGIPATFSFSMDLLMRRKGWPDKEIASFNFDHTLTYDNLKEIYRVTFSEKGGKAIATEKIEESKSLMSAVHDFKVCRLQDMIPGREYILRVKASLERKKLPLNFHYLIPFWRFWDFDTDYYSVHFKY